MPCAPRDPGLRERSLRLTPKGPRPQHGVAAGRGSLGGRWAGPRQATSLKDTAAPPTLPSVHCIRGGSQRPSRVFGGLSPSQAPPGPQGSSPLGLLRDSHTVKGPLRSASPAPVSCQKWLGAGMCAQHGTPSRPPPQASNRWCPTPREAGAGPPTHPCRASVHFGERGPPGSHHTWTDTHGGACRGGRRWARNQLPGWVCGGPSLRWGLSANP